MELTLHFIFPKWSRHQFFLLKIRPFEPSRVELFNKQLPLKLLVVALLLPVSYEYSRHILDGTPLDKQHADMLPVMKVMAARFLDGQWSQVYAPIQEIWNGIQPIYLPALWLPFSAAAVFNFDMRWITVMGIWFSVLLCIWPGRWKINGYYVLYALAFLTLLAWLHYDSENNVIKLTEEGIVFFYYSLMAVAIISGNPWLVGISAALCLLSRYAIIGWIPFAGLYLLFTRQYKYLLRAFSAGILVVVALILPFGKVPLVLHLNLPAQYVVHAERVWNENPEFFFSHLVWQNFLVRKTYNCCTISCCMGHLLFRFFFLF